MIIIKAWVIGEINLIYVVIVIGKLVEEELFSKKSGLGKYINLSGISYRVVGVFSDDGGDDEERIIYMPLSTAQQIYGNNDYVDQINIFPQTRLFGE